MTSPRMLKADPDHGMWMPMGTRVQEIAAVGVVGGLTIAVLILCVRTLVRGTRRRK